MSANESRFFMDHGVVHDRKTGKHVSTIAIEGGSADDLLALLRGLEVERDAWRLTAKAYAATERHATASSVSAVTQNLIDQLRERDAKGLVTYGATLDRTDLSPTDWLQHLTEELLDGAGYAQAAIRTIALARIGGAA